MQKLAIIIPYYKIKFFRETLQSLDKQTCKDFALYIGNDASPDNPEELIKHTLTDTPFSYFPYADNLGGRDLVAQWERIIGEMNDEDWFMILGDDDYISENLVESFYAHLPEVDQYGSNVIKFSQRWVDEHSIPFKEYTHQPKLLSAMENWKEKYMKGNRSSLSEHIFRKNAYTKNGFRHLPLAWGSDDLAVFEIAGEKPVFFIEEATVEVRISSENISGSKELLMDKQRNAIQFETWFINRYYKILPKEYILDRINQQISFAYHHRFSDLKLNLLKYYWYLRAYKNIITLPKTYLHIYFKRK